ncbi:hypothetical protein MMC09_005864 [Bachmanniomyces sp. S44760]|nr:hypothetical protein [Bachmanniomyces sp. S44760]
MVNESSPSQPSLPWRVASSATLGIFGSLSRLFIFGANSTEVHGLENFLRLVDSRRNIEGRERGLITVSNHCCVIDDPLIWGALPFRYNFSPSNHRWTLGSYDICFTNKFTSAYFTLGQVLPTHRRAHSVYGGLFQPTMTQAIRLLSSPSFPSASESKDERLSMDKANRSVSSPDLGDPFSGPHLTYSTNGSDSFPAPSSYSSRRYSWLHIFPEGFVHQHPQRAMRYFKWGVARLILEPEECPDVVPMWIEGNEQVMNEERKWPRFIPRAGKRLFISFGDNVGGEQSTVFAELRRSWRKLVDVERAKAGLFGAQAIGVLSEELKYGEEATALRIECTKRVRDEILKMRRARGLPEEDPKETPVEAKKREGPRREGLMDDGSLVKDV